MKKITQACLALIVTVAIVIDGYLLFFKNRSGTVQTILSSASSSSTVSATSQSSATSKRQSYQNGTYTGKATATRWGDVQVQAVIKAGKITTVNVLKYPNENAHDKEVNSQALPVYKSETLTKQSAKIQLVSGASETYKGFKGSLQDALDQAEA